jgi:hypothetical protein
MVMSEAYVFRISMPNADELKYNAVIQWDEGTQQIMGRSLMNVSDMLMLLDAFQPPNVLVRYHNHIAETERMHRLRPLLTQDIEMLIFSIELDITNALDEASNTHSIETEHVSDNKASTAKFLTSIRKCMDILFGNVAAGGVVNVESATDNQEAKHIATKQLPLLNIISQHSRETEFFYQNWIYATLRYQLRDSMQIIYRNHTAQNG